MNLSSLKQEKDQLFYSTAFEQEEEVAEEVIENQASERVEEKTQEEKPPVAKYWTDTENKRVYHFDRTDVEDVVSCFIKKGVKYKKRYELKGISVTFQSLNDREQSELNDIIQMIENKGVPRWKKMIQEFDNVSLPEDSQQKLTKVQTETQDIFHQDSGRAVRTATLAFYVSEFCGEDMSKMPFEQRARMLEEYNNDFLDWISYNIYMHFRGLLLEAIKSLSGF
jgi:hypothetical protein